jgi:Viral BACON domain
MAAGLVVLLAGLLVNGCRISKLLSRPTEGDAAGGGGGGSINVSPKEIVDSALAGESAARTTNLTVTNGGSWVASTPSTWIGVTPNRGGARATVRLSLDPKDLAPGLHIGVVTLQEGDSTGPVARVTVSFRIQQPILVLKPSSFTFTAKANNAVFNDTLLVSNGGDGPLNWSATTEHGASWLKLTNTAGTGAGKIAVRASNAGLVAYGTFHETIIVTAPGAKNSPQRIDVTLKRDKHHHDDDVPTP